MAFRVEYGSDGVSISLTGWDRLMNGRSSVSVNSAEIAGVEVETRDALEADINFRVLGFGTHNGRKRPGRRRVGTMNGRTVAGDQFWAVPKSGSDLSLLVLTLENHKYRRMVLSVPDVEYVAQQLSKISNELR